MKSLSQKIRHLRHNLKVKSQNLGDSSAEVKTKSICFRTLACNKPEENVSEEDMKRHLDEIKKEWESKTASNRNSKHIKMLLKQTRLYRADLLQKHPSGSLGPIFTEFPCFQDSQFVS